MLSGDVVGLGYVCVTSSARCGNQNTHVAFEAISFLPLLNLSFWTFYLLVSHFFRLHFYCTPPAAINAAIPAPTPKDLAAATPNSKVSTKAEYSKKRSASNSRSTPNQVAKRTRSATAHSSESSSRTNLAGDAIDKDFFPFAHGPYYATYPEEDVIVGSYKVSREVADLNGKVTASDAAFVKVKAKGKEHNKNIKSLSKTLDQFIIDAARLTSDLNQARSSDAQNGDHIAIAKTYLDDIYALTKGYKHSLAKKDAKIL
nr:hypothetical protein [Tanacetum cinerariifolium]